MGKNAVSAMKTNSYLVIFVWLLIVGGTFGINFTNVTKTQKKLAFQRPCFPARDSGNRERAEPA